MSDGATRHPAPQDGSPTKKYTPRMTSQAIEHAAKWSAAGRPDEWICERLDIKQTQLSYARKAHADRFELARSIRNEEVDQEVQDVIVKTAKLAKYAHEARKDVLLNGDPKTKALVAKQVVDELTASQGRSGPDIDVTVALQQNNIGVDTSLKDAISDFAAVFETALHQDDTRHVREGDEALPQHVLSQAAEAERRAEIIEAEFTGIDDDDTK